MIELAKSILRNSILSLPILEGGVHEGVQREQLRGAALMDETMPTSNFARAPAAAELKPEMNE